jgi:uncharacterized membrane protein YhaH (DUF805 family)
MSIGQRSSPPGWYPDPFGRHEYRYFDGTAWKDDVADHGAWQRDALALPPPTGARAGEAAPRSVIELEPDATVQVKNPAGAEPPVVAPLSMDEAVRRCLARYAHFSGRAPRSEYWWYALAMNLAVWIAFLVAEAVAGGLTSDIAVAAAVGRTVQGLLILALALPSLAVAVRRLHDTERSGWWLLVAFVPLLGPILVIVFLAMPGTAEPNRFGLPAIIERRNVHIGATIGAAARIPVLVGLMGVVVLRSDELARGYAIMDGSGYWARWALLTAAGLAFVAVLLLGRRRSQAWVLLGIEAVAAAGFAFAPQRPEAWPWPWARWLDNGIFGVGAGTWQLLGLVWLGVVVTAAIAQWRSTHPARERPTVEY